jgi:predicted dehydrogenase
MKDRETVPESKGPETKGKGRRPGGSDPINVVVVGVGHLGKQHARVYRELEGVRLVGVVDTDSEKAREVGASLDVPYYHELTPALLASIHAASVVTPTPTHLNVARRLIQNSVSVLVEKPMTSTLEEARALLEAARQEGVTLQVGHIERFNPVVLAGLPHIHDPIFIECDRIHPFSFRSVETSVVLDLMIHDIDIVLNLVSSPVAQLDAVGTRVLSDTEDLASARITFENGCTAMFKASRVAIQKNRKMRIFSSNSYLSLDYVAKTGMRISLKNGYHREKIDFKKMASLRRARARIRSSRSISPSSSSASRTRSRSRGSSRPFSWRCARAGSRWSPASTGFKPSTLPLGSWTRSSGARKLSSRDARSRQRA